MPRAATKQGQELLEVKPRATLASWVLSNLLSATEFQDAQFYFKEWINDFKL